MEYEEVITNVDIVDYISKYVELTEKNGEFWGLSPFKEEKTPSFSVRRENGTWYDFSSGKGGNLFHFIKEYHKCSSSKAFDIMLNEAGINDLPEKPNSKLKATEICKYYKNKLNKMELKQVVGLVKNESVNAEKVMSRFEFNTERLQIWNDEGISFDTMIKFGVQYDEQSKRIVYPIKSEVGNIVNIGGRTTLENFKELKLRKYTYFFQWNGQMNVVYGLYENMSEIIRKKEIILFEGMKSVLIAHDYGYENCGAILTSHLNPYQLKILVSLGVRIVFGLDKDVNPLDDKNIQKLKRYCNVEIIKDRFNLLDEKDAPVDKGADVFEKLYNERIKLR